TNLAHGEFVVLAAYFSLAISGATGLNPWLSLVLVGPIMFFIGFAIQNLIVNRLMPRGAEAPLLVMFGMSIIIQNVILQVFSADPQHLTNPLDTSSFAVGSSVVPTTFLIDCVVGVFVIMILNAFMKRTYAGMAVRAVSDDTTAAQIMGINVNLIYGIAMGIAMVTSAVAGVLVGQTYNFYPTTGSQYLIISFGIVVIGGMGSIKGTLVAGLIFGLAQLLGGFIFGTTLQLLAGYIIILIMLAVKPQGLFAK
ncbi:MAG: branched-chain amino acid ABC transporter permease, partial [Clostridiales Family XIII bacterium]|nr:branched-chain amino acid ABC transporter permease [Clostridiales Family XIII bacterium]